MNGETEKDKIYFKKMSYLIMSLAKINNIYTDKKIDTDNFHTCVSNNLKLLIPSSDIIDIASEVNRLSKEELKLTGQYETIQSRLRNKNFIDNAPGHVVVADEQKIKELSTKIEKIKEQLKNYSN